MDPKSRIMELEESKQGALDRFGDFEHQEKLTRRLLLKLDFRYFAPFPYTRDALLRETVG